MSYGKTDVKATGEAFLGEVASVIAGLRAATQVMRERTRYGGRMPVIEERDTSATALVALLSGAAVGAVAALLLAPQSGERSRNQLRRYARRAQRNIRDMADRAGDAFDEMLEDGKQYVESKKAVLRESIDSGLESVQHERGRSRQE
ncbi:hypothetical protein W02_35070 [Nitrospira sp. KM1]|uniref:YtxH domain-containing protein n=1 Tax=Nitrospira sp. KM1 TaxID=1936990 RepID=UPI0013A74B45|nr:YtxH domain-containing protein [Nitrospira sp. KM1]BCA56367.1 hypothetical protein W02_35070 [Nitrospira sp. KM1]